MPAPEIPPFPDLDGDTVRLRQWRADDVSTVIEASNDELIPQITTVAPNSTEADALAFIQRQGARPETDLGHALAIARADTDEAIGHLFVQLVMSGVKRCSVGYWIVPSGREAGAASEALDLASTWILANYDIERISLFIEPWNQASRRTAVRSGFLDEGLLRAWETYEDGVPRDMHVYSRVKG